MTQHEGIRPPVVKTGKTFDCDQCPYQATQLTSLKRHQMAKHSGQSFPCDKCDYVGTTPNNLRLHKGSKHEGVRYPCDICGYQATQTGVLNKHKELKHGFSRGSHHVNNNMHHTHYSNPPGPKPRAITTSAASAPRSGFFHFSQVGRPKIIIIIITIIIAIIIIIIMNLLAASIISGTLIYVFATTPFYQSENF